MKLFQRNKRSFITHSERRKKMNDEKLLFIFERLFEKPELLIAFCEETHTELPTSLREALEQNQQPAFGDP